MARGKWIQYLDADDYIVPGKVQKQVRFLEETGADAVYGDWRFRYHLPDGRDYLDKLQEPGLPRDILESLLEAWWVHPGAFLFRRQCIGTEGEWDDTLLAAQDRDFITNLALRGVRILYQPGWCSVYRRYGNVTVSTSCPRRFVEGHCRVLEKVQKSLAEQGRLSVAYRRALAHSYFYLAQVAHAYDKGLGQK
jgi:hypothetical protein